MKPIRLNSKEINWIEKKIPNLKVGKEVIYKTVCNGDISICRKIDLIELKILEDNTKVLFEESYNLSELINVDLPYIINKIIDFTCTISITVWGSRFKVVYNLLRDKTKHSYLIHYIEKDDSEVKIISALQLSRVRVDSPYPNLPRTETYSFGHKDSITYYRKDISGYLTKDILITEYIFWKSMWLELKKKGY